MLKIFRNLKKCNSYLMKHELGVNKQRTIMTVKECTDLVWMDLEMTGLDVKKDQIMEIACLITNKELTLKSEGICLVIHQPKEVLDNMNDWCQKHHNESGLVEKCLQSQISVSEAEEMVLTYLKQHVPQGVCPLAGNSVYMDRLFLQLHMPKVNQHLHYRIVDVSTIKEVARRFNHTVFNNAPKKKFVHRSLDDIEESIQELQYYKNNFFKL